jgi:hypothetical protein
MSTKLKNVSPLRRKNTRAFATWVSSVTVAHSAIGLSAMVHDAG